MDVATRLRLILRASAIYDWLALALLVAMPDFLFELFRHPHPSDPFLFRLAALPLWMAPFVYWHASSRVHGSLVGLSILLRVVGGLAIAALVLWHRPAGAAAYWTFVAGDLLWAALILVARRAWGGSGAGGQ